MGSVGTRPYNPLSKPGCVCDRHGTAPKCSCVNGRARARVMEGNSRTVFVFLAAFQRLKRRIESEELHEKYLQKCRRARRLRFCCQLKVQLVMFCFFLLSTLHGAMCSERIIWTKARLSDWWEQIVQECFREEDWQENFRTSHATFVCICNELRCQLL